MIEREDPKGAPPPHSARFLYGMIVALGVVFLAQAAMLATEGSWGLVVPGVIFGLAALYYGTRGLRLAAGVQRLNAAWNLIGLGRLAEAEAMLDAPVMDRLGILSASAAQQRAIIAMRRGDVAAAIAAADRALAAPIGWFSPGTSRLGRVRAHALRSLLRASSGDAKGAREDGAVVRAAIRDVPQGLQVLGSEPDVLLGPLARVELAEAVLLERSGGRDALRDHLAEHRATLMEGSPRRERAIVRAFERMLATKGTTPYRQRREPATSGEEPPLTAWIERLVPGAAAHVIEAPEPLSGDAADPGPDPTSRGIAGPAPSRAPGGSTVVRALWVLGTLGVALGGGAALVMRAAARAASSDDGDEGVADPLVSPWILLLVAMSLGPLIGSLVRARRRIEVGLAQLARRDLDAASATIAPVTRSMNPIAAAQAHLTLARIAAQRADFAAALRHCDAGLARVSGRLARMTASDIVLPELVADRAHALAALDRPGEAASAISVLAPPYPFLARARFRVQLVSRVRAGRLDDAARLARASSPDLPLDPRDELLADLVVAAAPSQAPSHATIERLERELRDDEGARRWIDAIAPGLAAALRRAPDDEGAVDERAEAEAAAEEELARDGVVIECRL